MQGNLLARLGTTTLGATKEQAKTQRINATQLSPAPNVSTKTPTTTPGKTAISDKTDTQLGPVVNNITKPTIPTPSRLEAGTNSNYLASAFHGGTALTAKTNASLYKPTRAPKPVSIGGGFLGGEAPLPVSPPPPPTADVMLVNKNDELLENPTDKFII